MTNLFEVVTARRAADLCGFRTVAMIDYLERSGVFLPTKKRTGHKGRRRTYSFRELLVLKAIGKLLENGASVSVLKTALRQFQLDKWSADRANLSNGEEILKYVVFSGSSVLYGKRNETLYDLSANGQMMFNFVLDVDSLHSELCGDLDQISLFTARGVA